MQMQTHPSRGLLAVVPPAALEASIREGEARQLEARAQPELQGLAAFIRSQFETFKRHRDSASGWSERLLVALRAFNGQYSPQQLAEIAKFGGSQVYARIIAMKCRAASALLRDVYLAPDRPWGLMPPADPDVPPEIQMSIAQLIQSELTNIQQHGMPIDPIMVRDRAEQLMDGARQAARKQASKRAKLAEDKIDEILREGGFYHALSEFLSDLPLFPFGCLKGPVVRIVPTVSWAGGTPHVQEKPKLFWQRVSPFDIWWTPGVSDIEDANVIERTRVSRAELNDLLDLPGYNTEGIRAVLDEYGRGGLNDNWDTTDSERAVQESREDPHQNHSGLISCLEYHGNVQGRDLLEYEVPGVQDELRDYMVQAWMIGRHIIKVQMSPSPRKRHPYFITSFEKVLGTPVGNGLPDLLHDVQDVCNATLRALVNNLAISSGPQVVVHDDRLAPGEDGDDIYPWKRWHVTTDPSSSSSSQQPIDFFQPDSRAQELLAVYKEFNNIGDELSAIPRYLSGNSPGSGGAGRTASGLAMLMGNASKLLQTVAGNVDGDVIKKALTQLYDMLMLTDESGVLTGEEQLQVMGVAVAVQRETQRARQLEFLQITANPIDISIMGPEGRGEVLRSVSETIGMDGKKVVPPTDEIALRMQQAQMAEQGGQAQGGQSSPAVTNDSGPRTRIAGGAG